MFWHVDDKHFVVDEIMDRSSEMLTRAIEKAQQGKICVNDLSLLKAALQHVYVFSPSSRDESPP